MAYSFPPSPSVGQIYTSNGRTWRYTGVQWTAVAVSSPTSAPVFVSVSPPPNPIQGSLWYNSNNSDLNIYYTDLNGSQWISVVPYPQDSITEQGGVFQDAIYAQYLIPNNDAAFITVGWFNEHLKDYLTQTGYVVSGNGIVLDSNSQILSIDSGLVI